MSEQKLSTSSEDLYSNMEQSFRDAARRIKDSQIRPSNGDLLILYGLYKQATAGDCNIPQPWAVQIEARSKWDAWNKNKGIDRMSAMRKYIDKVEEIMNGQK